MANRVHQQYVYRDCRYIKVDVEFEPVGSTEEKLDKATADKIVKISRLFLEWSIED